MEGCHDSRSISLNSDVASPNIVTSPTSAPLALHPSLAMAAPRSLLYRRGESTPRRTGTLDSDVRRHHTFPQVSRRRRRGRTYPEYSDAVRTLCWEGSEERYPYDYEMLSELNCTRCGCQGTYYLGMTYKPGRAGQYYYVVSVLLVSVISECSLSAAYSVH